MKKTSLFISLLFLLISCKKEEKLNSELSSTENSSEIIENSISTYKLSFKMDGKLVECNKGITCMSTPASAIVQGEFGNKNRMGIGFILEKDDSAKQDKNGNLIGNMLLTIDGKMYKFFEYWNDSEQATLTVSKAEKGIGGGGIPIKKLTGTFSGVLKDDKGNKITITEGKFSS